MHNYVGTKFDGSDPVTIFSFLGNFVRGCNAFSISEGNAIWVIQDFMKGIAKTFKRNSPERSRTLEYE